MKTNPKAYWQSLSAEEKQRVAAECDSTVNYIRHIFHERRPAGWDLCKKIEKATAGQVTCSRLRPDIFGGGEAA